MLETCQGFTYTNYPTLTYSYQYVSPDLQTGQQATGGYAPCPRSQICSPDRMEVSRPSGQERRKVRREGKREG